jgi:hypothetical protein
MRCPICDKEIPKDLCMHACHMAARKRDWKHLKMAVKLSREEQEIGSKEERKLSENVFSDSKTQGREIA